MPNVLGFIRHHCGDGVGQFVVLGNVDRKGETIGWGMALPNGPDPSQFGWSYCPWCSEPLPQLVRDWQQAVDPTSKPWNPFGIGDKRTMKVPLTGVPSEVQPETRSERHHE